MESIESHEVGFPPFRHYLEIPSGLRPECTNHVWSYDFVSAKTYDGRAVGCKSSSRPVRSNAFVFIDKTAFPIQTAFPMLVLQPSLRLVKENLTFTGEDSPHRSDAEYHVACAHFERELTLLLKAVASFS
jgi:hypothetical protein